MTTTFDVTTPTGSEAMSSVDDRIRELKLAIQDMLRGGAAEGTEALTPGSSPLTAPVFRYRGLKGTTAARPASGQYGLYINTTKNTLQRDNSSSWEDVATLIPSGTVMAFFQAAPPVGWTQVTTQNDKALRVVSGTGGGTGGVDALSTPPSTAHTHSIASANIDHYHEMTVIEQDGGALAVERAINGKSTAAIANGTTVYTFAGTSSVSSSDWHSQKSNTMSANASHDHGAATGSTSPTAFTPKYIDMILASKD